VDCFIKDRSFLNLQSFGFLERTPYFQTASAGVSWTSQSLCSYQIWAKWSRRFGRLSALTIKRRCFILANNSQPKFGRKFGTRLHKLRYKIISEW